VRQAELVRYLVLAAQREGSRRLTQELRAMHTLTAAAHDPGAAQLPATSPEASLAS
jgi:hypothetical protein